MLVGNIDFYYHAGTCGSSQIIGGRRGCDVCPAHQQQVAARHPQHHGIPNTSAGQGDPSAGQLYRQLLIPRIFA